MRSLYVINSNREEEPFSFQKLYRSIISVGVPKKTAREIAGRISKEIYPGIATSEISKKVKRALSQEVSGAALRFNLKEGMRKLGPTGFLFEKFVAEIFKELGFEVKINQHLPGYCLDNYEIDFLAKKKDLLYVGECKYRNLPGDLVRLKDILANHARFHDLINGPFFKANGNCKAKSILVTNAKFTSEVIRYSSCSGIELLGWRYPRNNSLEGLIEKNNLYPVTVFPSLKGYIKDAFVADRMMLVRDLAKINLEKFSNRYKIPQKYLIPIKEEAKTLVIT